MPYMHIFVCYMHEFIEEHSCAPIEKKNYQHIFHFFQQTFKDGSKSRRKSSIIDILEYENRVLFYHFNDLAISTLNPKKIHIS